MRASFCHLGGLGISAERRLWNAGVVTWGEYRRSGLRFFSSQRHRRVLKDIEASEEALASSNLSYFLRVLPVGERVRILPLVRDHLLFLDIETTGLGRDASITTVATWSACTGRLYVRGRNLASLAEEVQDDALLVTYNGDRFDLPFLRREFPSAFTQTHLDLLPVLRERGIPGGLKACERQLGVQRRRHQACRGRDAVALWQRCLDGNEDALVALCEYNLEDALSLERLLLASWNASMAACPLFPSVPVPFHAPVIHVPRGK